MIVSAASVATDARSRRRGVVIASSMGGVAALSVVLSNLPLTLLAAVFVVQHLAAGIRSRLDEVLNARCVLPVHMAQGGEAPLTGEVFLAPSGRHLLITESGVLALSDTAPVAYVRPSANVLFESAAAFFGTGTIAVVLTGRGRDGTLGALAVKRAGGVVIAQDESSSYAFGMPGAAIASGCVDYVLPLERIAPRILALVRNPAMPYGAARA